MLDLLANTVPWPFPVRPSLENLADPEVHDAVALALIQAGLAVLLVAAAAALRVRRSAVALAALAALVLIGRQAPVVGWLLVAAYPTTFRPSPTGFTAASIETGRTVFAANCVACHGKAGDGIGGRGPDADLRQHHIWEHPEGDLFWFVSHGIEGPDGKSAMPPFAAILPEAARWAAIDYVYALNVGAVAHGVNGWPHRVAAPDLALTCAGRKTDSLKGLRGTAVRLLLGPLTAPPSPLPPVNGIDWATVWVADDAAEPPLGVECVARSGAAAYAVLAGAPDGHVSSARFLIDPQGVLRSVWRQGDGPALGDPASLLAEARTICTEPLTIDNGEFHEHH